MLSPLQQMLIEAVQNCPGIGPGGVADMIGRDKSQTRRAMRDLAQRGYLTEQNDGSGYAYYPALNSAGSSQDSRVVRKEEVRIDRARNQVVRRDLVGPNAAEQITDLVPVRHSNGQVIHQLNDGRSRRLQAVPREWLGGLDGQMFDDGAEVPHDDDPGDWPTAAAPITPRSGASKAVTVSAPRPPEPSLAEICSAALMAFTKLPALNSENSREAVSERRRLEKQNEALQNELLKLKGENYSHEPEPIRQHVDFVEEDPADDAEDYEDEFDPAADMPVNFDDLRYAKRELTKIEKTGDYGDEPFAVVEGADGSVCVKPQLIKPSFSELILVNKYRRAARQPTLHSLPHPASPGRDPSSLRPSSPQNSVHKFLTKSKPIPENDGQPPVPRSGRSWLRARFSTPRKSQWR